jgi:hypothetical protein
MKYDDFILKKYKLSPLKVNYRDERCMRLAEKTKDKRRTDFFYGIPWIHFALLIIGFSISLVVISLFFNSLGFPLIASYIISSCLSCAITCFITGIFDKANNYELFLFYGDEITEGKYKDIYQDINSCELLNKLTQDYLDNLTVMSFYSYKKIKKLKEKIANLAMEIKHEKRIKEENKHRETARKRVLNNLRTNTSKTGA